MFTRPKLSLLLLLTLSPLLASSASAADLSLGAKIRLGKGTIGVSYRQRPAIRPVCGPACRTWIPGRYETVSYQVFVPGRVEKVWMPAVYENRCGPRGGISKVRVQAGYWKTVRHRGHYDTRYKRVWKPGHWSHRHVCR